MNFEVYNYQCSPLSVEEGFFTSEAQAYRAEALQAMEEHLEIIDRMLTADKLDYPMDSKMGVPFKEGNLLRLIRKKARKRKGVSDKLQAELTRPYLKALVLYAREGFYVMRVQNKTLLSSEREWEKRYDINEPSCLAILANTYGRQLLLVEVNGAFGTPRKRSTQAVADIFEDTFKALLKPHKLDVNFRPHYGTRDVWKCMMEKYKQGIALKSLYFEFDYPNMAEDARLLGGYFEEIGISLNAAQEYKLKGHHGQPLNFDPNEQKRNPDIASIVEYGGKTGNKQEHTFMDGTKRTYNADRLGVSVLQALGKLLSILIRLQEEHTQRQQTSLFDEPLTATLRDELAKWLNGLTAEA